MQPNKGFKAHLQVGHINTSPIDSEQVQIATINDPIHSHVRGFVNHLWPSLCPSEELQLFYLRLTELTSEDDVLRHKLRNVVPSKLRNFVRELLHNTHINAVRMEGKKKAKTRKQNFDRDLS